ARTFTKCFKLHKSQDVQRIWNALPVVESTLETEANGSGRGSGSRTGNDSSLIGSSAAHSPAGRETPPAAPSGGATPALTAAVAAAATSKRYESANTLPLFLHSREKWEKRRASVIETADAFPRRVTPHSLAKTEEKLGALPSSHPPTQPGSKGQSASPGHYLFQGHETSLRSTDHNHQNQQHPQPLAGPAPGDPENAPEPEDARPLNADRPGGTEYGTWWHSLMESLPWNGPAATPEARRHIFEASLHLCQLPERARREFALLENTTLPDTLSTSGLILHTELPFLLPHAGGDTDPNCLEGIIDMAWFDPAADAWTVLDWKTNFISSGQSDELKLMYAPQLQAYARALSALTGKPARAYVYATTIGQLMDVDAPAE
ncbi:MAG TPA: PD-(D/E)XK nuclease family protein, partial [Candidatus Methylacidiphilales bacterium]|nr:PD-(D/E)XK nuclease family protein [Candidatus Methylacidiphilales bacterium]